MQETRSTGIPMLPVVGIVAGILLIALAEFVMDGLADQNATWHWMQHGVFFLGGLVTGVSGTMVHQSAQR